MPHAREPKRETKRETKRTTKREAKPGDWRKRLHAGKQSKLVTLDKPFAGIPAGAKLFIATPEIVARYVAEIPYGEVRTIERLRNELARRNRADATCPVTAAMFLRIACEAAWDELEAGTPIEQVVPFWRAVAPDTPIAKRLRCGGEWLQRQREIEATRTAREARARG